MTPIPPVLTSAVVLRLQGTIGNRAVCRLLNAAPLESAPVAQPAAEPIALSVSTVPVPAPTASLARRVASFWRRFSNRRAT